MARLSATPIWCSEPTAPRAIAAKAANGLWLESAIHAAAHPAHVSYLYYVAGSDGCGEEVFSTSYAQFEKNAAAYREAIAKNGGHVPTCKKG